MSCARRALATLLLASGACAHANDIPTRSNPSFDPDKADTAIVVAHVSAGGQLPAFARCGQPNVVCMHSPFWFKAQVLQTLLGRLSEPVVNVSTESHGDMKSYVHEPATQLLRLKSHGGEVYLPLYEFRRLHARRDGELFIIVTTPRPFPA